MADWDERYTLDGYYYGIAPNGFLVSVLDRMPKGKILALAEGEGRNAVYLAEQGYDVTGVDGSEVGLRKAEALARERGVTITTLHADLNEYVIVPGSWDGIVLCYCHLPSGLRRRVHAAAAAGLRPGGVLILEAFSTEQLRYGTGGPPSLDMLMDLDDVCSELAGLQFLHAISTVRDVREGRGHTGTAAVIQIVAANTV